ncbi:MAG: isoaspartyl peptidase/L-asparaginase [Verrucomicrobiota bacterium]|jgi:beta-aspartyl-peptidase (threonine type)|nr:isoaspartyl peptidase/L-asparaginase [Verrucomicrobiota bacterium]MDP7441956.1 isoaspartyl peptidase/L-asparaginase [Verrucomicrobiota bacterium]|tara:strand:- start:564 stop:1559 length:996 start_codon:yes stop_codon:yes gene_type:complete
MKPIAAALLLFTAMTAQANPVAIVIHGGAGRIDRDALTPERERLYHATLEQSLRAGHTILKRGGSALDAVEAAIVIMEDAPVFNAGKGAVFTAEGKNELDASIMDGRALQAGAVGGVTTVKNPIRAARAVMEKSPHVLFTNRGAEKFASDNGLEMVDPKYFFTERRWKQILKWRKQQEAKAKPQATAEPDRHADYFGTVGCVALDTAGNIAAGTSTGGMTGKRFGRIGDSPIIGAGTYADNRTAGISCTGHGEYFIRHAVAHDISARMAYKQESLAKAAADVVQTVLKQAGGSGGIIGLDAKGNIVMEFNTPAMTRGAIDQDGNLKTALFK